MNAEDCREMEQTFEAVEKALIDFNLQLPDGGGALFADRGVHLLVEELLRRENDLDLWIAEAGRWQQVAAQAVAACEAFVAAWERSEQLEKTDTALMLARAAVDNAGKREAVNDDLR